MKEVYTPQEIRELLTDEVIAKAIEEKRMLVRYDEQTDDDIKIAFPDVFNPEGEEAYVYMTDVNGEDYMQMPEDVFADAVRELLAGLVEDDAEMYEDEISYYTNLVLAE